MVWHLISATPSPYARKIRIALQEKNLPFELQTEVPWDHTTQTPTHNPLEKLPVLILDDGKAVYESHYILDWLETKYPDPSLLPKDVDDRLLAKQIEVVADGVCDALVLAFFEMKREKESQPWKDRHTNAQGHWRVLGFMAVRWPDHGWKSEYPNMEKYWRKLEERPNFASTVPVAQKFSDPVV
ncbi:hypothetical protein B0A48_13500 [Cryoendolithus antarcticus]|uniref:GST N-terminal domain-containing protein n=1 Tax=Cryoendolithus antarcticus TaxID=1507870 RepID=A0A1V8SNU3_9PEZI|nr:hypothetical protein B0A48_13500 [Cryoendolithus antarcticus]